MVLGISFLDTSLKTVDEAENALRLPVLCALPQMGRVRRNGTALVFQENGHSEGAEGFRTLRTSLSMLGPVKDRRVFLFTSAMPQEGKTFCSVNYAASLAQLGLKTLLIDGDLRRPTVESTLLGERTEHAGVSDFLTGQKTFQQVLQPSRVERLDFISAGTESPNAAELLAKDALSALVEEALKHYDRVVVDSAPIHAVSDTLLMLKSVQTVCLVIRAARTSCRSVLRAVHLLRQAEAPLAGIILNRMPRRWDLGYGDYYYGPYYDYSYRGKYLRNGKSKRKAQKEAVAETETVAE
jgi:capsular exopolysaccharide synthesis family protein